MKGACGNCSCGDTGIRICGCVHCPNDTQPDPATPEPSSSDSVDEPIPSDSVDEPIPSDSEDDTSNNDTGLEDS